MTAVTYYLAAASAGAYAAGALLVIAGRWRISLRAPQLVLPAIAFFLLDRYVSEGRAVTSILAAALLAASLLSIASRPPHSMLAAIFAVALVATMLDVVVAGFFNYTDAGALRAAVPVLLA
ncbi:MAG: hypothetical protein ACYDEW_02755, partial [Vulcanimicrobiaceae bacterium]